MEGGKRPWIVWRVENNRVQFVGRAGKWADAFAHRPNSYPDAFNWMSSNDRTKITEEQAREIVEGWGATL